MESRTKKAALNIIVKFGYQLVALITGLIVPRLILETFGSSYNGAIVYFISYYWIFWKVFKEAFISKKGEQKYRAFALAVIVSLFIFDYGAVSYSLVMNVIMIAMSLRVLTFEKDKIVKEI